MPVWYHPPPVLIPAGPQVPGQPPPAPVYHFPPPICIDPSPDAQVPPGAPTSPTLPMPGAYPTATPFGVGPVQPASSVPIPVLPYPQYSGGVAPAGPNPAFDYQPAGMHPAAAHFGQPQNATPGQQNLQPEFPQSIPATQIPPTKPNYVRERLYHYDAGDNAPPTTVPVYTEGVCCSRSGPLNAPAGEPHRHPPHYTGENGRRVSAPPNYHQAGIDSPAHRHRHSRHVEFSTDDSGGFAVELTHGCRSCGKGLRVSSAGMSEGEGNTDQGRLSCDQCVAERQVKEKKLAEEERLREEAKAREISKEQMRKEVRAELEKEDAERREMENILRMQAEEKARREELIRLASEELEKKRIDEEVKIELERRRLEDLRIREEVRLREVEKERLRKQSEIDKERKRKEAELEALEAAKQRELEKEIDRRMRMEDEKRQKIEENRIREEEKERRRSEARERLREDIKRERLFEEQSKKLEAARIEAEDARLKELETQRLDAEKQEKQRLQAQAERILREKIRKELEEEDRARLEAGAILKAKEANEERERLRSAEETMHEQRLQDEVERLHLEKDLKRREYIRAQQSALDRAKIKQQLIEEAAAAKFAEQAQRKRIGDEIIASGWQAGQLIDEGELMRRLGGSCKLTHLAAPPPVIPNVPPIAPNVLNAGLGHFSNSPIRAAPDANNPSVSVAPPPPPPHREKVNLHWETNCPQQSGHRR